MKKQIMLALVAAQLVGFSTAYAQSYSERNSVSSSTTVLQYADTSYRIPSFEVNNYGSVNAEFARHVKGVVQHLLFNLLGDQHRPALIALRRAATELAIKAQVQGDASQNTFRAAMKLVQAINSNSGLIDELMNSLNPAFNETAECLLAIKERVLELYRTQDPGPITVTITSNTTYQQVTVSKKKVSRN